MKQLTKLILLALMSITLNIESRKIGTSFRLALFILIFGLGIWNSFSQNTWTPKKDFGGTARQGAVGFSIGTKGYIGTGNDGGGSKKDFWEYDPGTNTWSQKADFGGTARWGAVGFAISNKGYIGTGLDGAYPQDFWEYDPSANAWTKKADFVGIGRNFAVGFAIGNKGYIGTGNNNATYYKDFWEYDPIANSWTKKTDFVGERYGAAGFSIGSKGYIGTGGGKDFYEYDPTADTWTPKQNFGGTARESAVGFAIGTKGYIGIGGGGFPYKNDFWEYDPVANTWTPKADLGGTGRYRAVGFSIGCKGYIGTGFSGGYLQDLWEYTSSGLTVSISKDTTICKGKSVTLTATEGTKYLWNTGNPADTTASITVTPVFSTTYIVNVSIGSCSVTDTVKVNVVTIAAVVTGNTALCKNESTVLTANCQLPAATFLWNTGDTTKKITAKPSNVPDTTIYYVVISNGMCTDTAFATMKVTTVTAGISAKDTVLCKGSSTTLTASGGTKYVWNTGDTTATITVNPLADTKYSVTVFNSVCLDTAQTSIKVNPLPTVNAEKDTTLTSGSSVILSASGIGIINYLWTPTTGLSNAAIFNPTATPTATTVYVVIGTDTNNCSNKDSVTIIVKDKEGCKEFYIPTAFSPNDNKFNDVLYIRGCLIDKKEVKETNFVIWDRWGEKVFETTDITKGWDGTHNGKALNTAVFVYYLKATLTTDEVIEQKGNISLIR